MNKLKEVIQQGEDAEALLMALNEGIDNALRLLQSLPIENAEGVKDLERLQGAVKKVCEIYGTIPKGMDFPFFRLYDQTAALGFEMAKLSKKYAVRQEQNVKVVFKQAVNVSPKGAQRMTDSQQVHLVEIVASGKNHMALFRLPHGPLNLGKLLIPSPVVHIRVLRTQGLDGLIVDICSHLREVLCHFP